MYLMDCYLVNYPLLTDAKIWIWIPGLIVNIQDNLTLVLDLVYRVSKKLADVEAGAEGGMKKGNLNEEWPHKHWEKACDDNTRLLAVFKEIMEDHGYTDGCRHCIITKRKR